mgnify:CR=1 FL=1
MMLRHNGPFCWGIRDLEVYFIWNGGAHSTEDYNQSPFLYLLEYGTRLNLGLDMTLGVQIA